jgi:hypothetical protein
MSLEVGDRVPWPARRSLHSITWSMVCEWFGHRPVLADRVYPVIDGPGRTLAEVEPQGEIGGGEMRLLSADSYVVSSPCRVVCYPIRQVTERVVVCRRCFCRVGD